MKRFNYLSLIICFVLSGNKMIQAQCNDLPYVSFEYSIMSDGYSVAFTSIGCSPNPITYTWSFGDGATSNELDPTHIYSIAGTYVVTLTVTDDVCGFYSVERATIVINPSAPSAMWTTLNGPSKVSECQQVTYSVDVTGGVPPYTYLWDFGGHVCTDCPFNCNGVLGNGTASQQVSFAKVGNGHEWISVTVIDAVGQEVFKDKEITVGQGVEVDILLNPDKSVYDRGETIVFFPDITNFNELVYPIDYKWEFGDGVEFTDNFDGGGIAIHEYENSGYYPVTLTVKDAVGSYVAQTGVFVEEIVPPGGGPGNDPECFVKVAGHQVGETVALDYDLSSGEPFVVNIEMMENNLQGNCNGSGEYSWTVRMEDCGFGPIFDNVSACTNSSNITLQLGNSWTLHLLDDYYCWPTLTQDSKPWGCVSVTAVKSLQPSGQNCCPGGVTNNCLVYIKPDPISIADISATGSCRDYELSAEIDGGGWKKEPNTPPFQNYEWTVYDPSFSQELDVLDDPSAEHPKFDMSKPFFQNIEEEYNFYIKLKVTDYANQTAELIRSIDISPFVLLLESNIDRCPGELTVFNPYKNYLASGGGSGVGYQFTWSTSGGDLQFESGNPNDPFPTFTAPSNGTSKVYDVDVQLLDAPGGVAVQGCILSEQVTVQGNPVSLAMATNVGACEINGSTLLGPQGIELSGGSGKYRYYWSTADPADLAYLNYKIIRNPTVSGVPYGSSIDYTLLVTDDKGGCTASAQTTVVGK